MQLELSFLPIFFPSGTIARSLHFPFLPGVFERAFDYFRTVAPELKEERAMLLEEWLNLESSFSSIGDVSIVQKKLPRKVKRKRAIASEDGTPTGYAHLFSLSFCSSIL